VLDLGLDLAGAHRHVCPFENRYNGPLHDAIAEPLLGWTGLGTTAWLGDRFLKGIEDRS
jgi:hypothetical protein